MNRPNFFMVGAPKCATTAMYAYLSQHPEVFLPERKELHFFGSDLAFKHARLTKEEYLSYFAAAARETRIGEASVWYLYSKLAAVEMKEFSPSAKVIIMLRNPADMMYSLHAEHLYNDDECIADFEEALAAEEQRRLRLQSGQVAATTMVCLYREVATYTRQIQRYFAAFGRENVQTIIFDDLSEDVSRIFKETCEFLDVNSGFLPHFPVVNANKFIRSNSLRRALQATPPSAQWLGRTLPVALRRKLRRQLRRLNTVYKPRAPMNHELRRRLQIEFLPEVERLSELLGRDLTHWCQCQGSVQSPERASRQ